MCLCSARCGAGAGTLQTSTGGVHQPSAKGWMDGGLCKPLHQGLCKTLHRGPSKSLHQGLCKTFHWGSCKPLHQGFCKPLQEGLCKPLHQDLCKLLHQGLCKPLHRGSCNSLHQGLCKTLHENLCKPLHQGLCKPLYQSLCKPFHQGLCETLHQVCANHCKRICANRHTRAHARRCRGLRTPLGAPSQGPTRAGPGWRPRVSNPRPLELRPGRPAARHFPERARAFPARGGGSRQFPSTFGAGRPAPPRPSRERGGGAWPRPDPIGSRQRLVTPLARAGGGRRQDPRTRIGCWDPSRPARREPLSLVRHTRPDPRLASDWLQPKEGGLSRASPSSSLAASPGGAGAARRPRGAIGCGDGARVPIGWRGLRAPAGPRPPPPAPVRGGGLRPGGGGGGGAGSARSPRGRGR